MSTCDYMLLKLTMYISNSKWLEDYEQSKTLDQTET